VWESNLDRVLITRNLLILLEDVGDVGDVAEGVRTIPYKNRLQKIWLRTALGRWRIQIGYTTTAFDRSVVVASAAGVSSWVGECAVRPTLDVVDSKAVTANASLLSASFPSHQNARPYAREDLNRCFSNRASCWRCRTSRQIRTSPVLLRCSYQSSTFQRECRRVKDTHSTSP
jgi:hypothetical protein